MKNNLWDLILVRPLVHDIKEVVYLMTQIVPYKKGHLRVLTIDDDCY